MDLRVFAGLDVGNGSVTVCLLSEKPADLKRYWQTNKPMVFDADVLGLDALLAIEFDCAVLEPTGGHYSKIWAHHLRRVGKKVVWAGHDAIAAYRKIHDLPNKNDWSDAIALACYGVEKIHNPKNFVENDSTELRQLYQSLRFVTAQRTPWINRLRQQLASEWPEVAKRNLDSSEWGKVADNRILTAIITGKTTPAIQRDLDSSIGIGVSPFTRAIAAKVRELYHLQTEIEQQIDILLGSPELRPYVKVLERYAMPPSSMAAFLSRVYPIEQFLVDGRPQVERMGEKRTKRNRSLSSYKLALGMGMVQYQSGGTWKWKPGGPPEVRSAIWIWIKMAIVMRFQGQTPELIALRSFYENGIDAEKDGRVQWISPEKGSQRIMKVARRALESIFWDLVRMEK